MAIVNTIALGLIQEFEESTDDAGFVSKIELRILEALDEIAIATDWNHFKTRDTFNTAIGTAQYNAPVGAREIIQLRYTATGEPIHLWSTQEAARRGIILEEAGRARAWFEDGNVLSGVDMLYRIRLWPVPSAVAAIEREYYYHPSATASGSTLPVQDQHLVAVKDRVRAVMLRNDQKYDAAALAQRDYEKNLERLVKKEQSKVADKTTLQEVDLVNARRMRGPRFPSNYPDYW